MASRTLNILLTEEEVESNDEVINFMDENLFELHRIIKASDIRLSTRHDFGGKELFAFAIGTKDLGLCYVIDAFEPPIIKNIPWFQGSCKAITALCFDPSGYWLLVASIDGSLHIVPVAGSIDAKRKSSQNWKNTDDIITFPSLNSHSFCSRRPSSLIWWQCMTISTQIGIIGTEQGEIFFVDLDTGQLLGFTRIDEYVSNFQICQDSELDEINLIITSQSKKQWQLVLEQPSNGFVYVLNNNLTCNKLHSQASRDTTIESINSQSYSTCDRTVHLSNPSPIDSSAFLVWHYMDHGQHLYTRYFPPKNILTIHEKSSSLLPLCIHKLPDYSTDVFLSHQFFYVIDGNRQTLYIISRSLSEDKLKGNSQFNQQSVVAHFFFGKRNELINGLFISNAYKDIRENLFLNNEEPCIIPKVLKVNKIILPPVKPCIIVSNRGIYRVTLRSSLLPLLMELIISRVELEKAKRLAKIFGLYDRQLLEYAGNILLANHQFYQAVTMYKEARCRPSKIFANIASVGCTSELLNCLKHFLEYPAPLKLSIAERMSLSNLSIIAFTELAVRATTLQERKVYKEFRSFLSNNTYYDELVAVSIIGQAYLWNILHQLVLKRGLFAQVLDIIMKTLPLFFTFKHSQFHSNHDLLIMISEANLINGMIENPNIAQNHMSFILANLSTLQIFVLQRLLELYDPTNPILRPLMIQCRTQHKSNSQNVLSNSVESSDIQEEMSTFMEKIIEMFLIILLVLIQKKTPKLSHSYELMKTISLSGMEKDCNQASFNAHFKRKFLSAGFSHVALVRNRAIFTWGSTIKGCLGRGPMTSAYETPQEIVFFRRMNVEIYGVSSGHCHTLALTNNGIYTWGGSQFGQMGVGTLTQCSNPQLITSLAEELIIDTVAGQYHSVAVTSDGRVFTWGWGVHGQLGHGNTENMHVPTLVISLLGTVISHISAGHTHTMLLSSDGIVYMFGCNNVGQLGTNDCKKSLFPKKVSLLSEKISLISTKYFHNLAVSSTNKLYVWGISPQELRLQKLNMHHLETLNENEKQNLSWPSSCVKDKKLLIKNCSDTLNTCIQNAENNDMIRTNSHTCDEVFYDGYHRNYTDKRSNIRQSSLSNNDLEKKGDGGILNSAKIIQGKEWKRSRKSKTSLTEWKPSLVDTSLVKGQILQISTGLNHSSLLTNDGTVYIWGKNTCGQLGYNNRYEVYRPSPLIYNPISSFSQLAPINNICTLTKKENYILTETKSGKYSLNNDEERANNNNNNSNNDDDYNDDNDSTNNGADDGDHDENVNDVENKDNYYIYNDLSEAQIDGSENNVNSNDLAMKAVDISCGSNYTVAVQIGGNVLAWGKIGISHPKKSAVSRIRKDLDNNNCGADDNCITLKYLFHTVGPQKSEGLACISHPSQVANIPAAIISYKNDESVPFVGRTDFLCRVEKTPGEMTLHYALELFRGLYDAKKILKRCTAVDNKQACAKLALLEHNFADSLRYQLESLMDDELVREVNNEDYFVSSIYNESINGKQLKKKSPMLNNSNESSRLFNEQAEKDLINNFEESVSKRILKMSASKSMDTFSLTDEELNTFDYQGGSEEMCEQTEYDTAVDQLTKCRFVNDHKFKSNKSFEWVTNENLSEVVLNEESGINYENSFVYIDKIAKAIRIIEFYIKRIEKLNYTILRDVLLNAIDIWIDHHLPLLFLETIFLKHLDKTFYPLSLLLFCQNNPLEEDTSDVKKEVQIRIAKGVHSLSTKLILSVLSMLLQHIHQGQSAPEYIALLSQSMAEYYGTPLTGYPGSLENQTIKQMLKGMKPTLSSNQCNPRAFIHIKDPNSLSRFLEMEQDVTVFTCGHYFPVSSYETKFISRMETELLASQLLPLPCTAQMLGRVLHQLEELDILCPLCIPRALQTVMKYLRNK